MRGNEYWICWFQAKPGYCNHHRAFAHHFDVYTEFANLDGIAKGAKVRVAGMDAGEVVDIAVPDRPPARFRLKLSIEQRLHALVGTDSVVTEIAEGVVGDNSCSYTRETNRLQRQLR
jgi:ABC-type transporter Mla subunit MlaD